MKKLFSILFLFAFAACHSQKIFVPSVVSESSKLVAKSFSLTTTGGGLTCTDSSIPNGACVYSSFTLAAGTFSVNDIITFTEVFDMASIIPDAAFTIVLSSVNNWTAALSSGTNFFALDQNLTSGLYTKNFIGRVVDSSTIMELSTGAFNEIAININAPIYAWIICDVGSSDGTVSFTHRLTTIGKNIPN